jgi:hypothetical protein
MKNLLALLAALLQSAPDADPTRSPFVPDEPVDYDPTTDEQVFADGRREPAYLNPPHRPDETEEERRYRDW